MGTLARKKAKNKKEKKNAKIPSESDSSIQLQFAANCATSRATRGGSAPSASPGFRVLFVFWGGTFKPERHDVRADVWQEGGQGLDGRGGDPEAAGDRGDAHEEAGVPGKED